MGYMIVVVLIFLFVCFVLVIDVVVVFIYVFGQLMLLSLLNVMFGIVVGCYYFMFEDVCGKSICQIIDIMMNLKGSVWGSISGFDLEINVFGLLMWMLIDGKVVVLLMKVILCDMIEVQLFCDSCQLKDGLLNLGFFNGYYYIYYKFGIFGEMIIVFFDVKVSFINGMCFVFDQNVMLLLVQKCDFNGVGLIVGVIDFYVQLNNCLVGYNCIGYQLDLLDDVVVGMFGGMWLCFDVMVCGVGIYIVDVVIGWLLMLW